MIQDGRARWQGNLVGDLASELRAWGEARQWPEQFDNRAFKGRTLRLGAATPRAVNLAAAAGHDLEGAELIATPDDLYHAQREHFGARERRADQPGLTPVDMDVIPHVWRNPDTVEPSQKKGAKGERALKFWKWILGRNRMVGFDQRDQNQYYPTSYLVKKSGESPNE